MMFKYALSSHNELTEADLACLEILNPELSSAHQKRQASFLCARKALQKLVPPTPLQSLQLNEFHFLANFPSQIFSVAHTKELAIAVMAEKKDYRSIGVDLEFKDRLVKAGSDLHYINQHDERSITDLELWCVKEASYKATSILYNKNFVLKDLWIKEKKFGHVSDPMKVLGEYELVEKENLIIGFAVLYL